MPFDRSKDKELFKEVVTIGEAKLTIGVYSYDGNAAKVQFTRQRKDDKNQYGWSFAKLGRMTKEELVEVLPLLERALDKM